MKQKIILIATLFLFAFIFNGCKKKNAIQEEIVQPDTEKFFQVPADISAQLKAVVDDIKKQNEIYNFVHAFSKRNGFPVWDKVVSNVSIKKLNSSDDVQTNGNAAFLIPLKIPGGSISSYIACLKTDTGYSYRICSRPKLESLARDSTEIDNSNLAAELQKIIDAAGGIGNITTDAAKIKVEALIDRIKTVITSNPGVNLNNLIF